MRCPVCDYDPLPANAEVCPRCHSPLDRPSGVTHIDLDMDIENVQAGAEVTGVEMRGSGDVYIDVNPRRIAQQRRNRQALLNIIWISWIEGVLEKIEDAHAALTGGQPLITLNRHYLRSAVSFHSDAADEISYLSESLSDVPSEGNINDLFQENNHSLLILGEPGSGKTTALLQIARELCRNAWRDEDEPIPVVLNLASWSNRNADLAAWIIEELNTNQYRVPQKIGQEWIEQNELIILLDGLDEVPLELRDDCVRAVNHFSAAYFTGIAICCRRGEYEDLIQSTDKDAKENLLQLRSAILLESLADSQIDDYLHSAGRQLSEIRKAIEIDHSLRELIRTPLMLGIISVTYRDVPLEHLPTQPEPSPIAWRKQLFDAYIARMFAYKGSDDKPYTDSQTTTWLSWLARQLTLHNQVTFLTEGLQPSWLPRGRWQNTYMLASRIIVMLFGGTIGGFVLGIANSITLGQFLIWLGFIQGVIGGTIAGVVCGVVDIIWIDRRGDKPLNSARAQLLQSTSKFFVLVMAVWLAVFLGFGLLSILLADTSLAATVSLGKGFQVGLILGLCCGWIFGFGPSGVRHTWSNDIQSVERLSWSGSDALRNGLRGAIIGIFVGIVATYVARLTPLTDPIVARFADSNLVMIVMMFISAIFLGLAGAFLGGVRGSVVDSRDLRPNQGFRMSIINAVITAVIVGALFGFLGAITGSLIGGPEVIFTMALYGIFFGVIAAFWYGGLFAFQHATLRWLLAHLGHTPRLGRLTPFLLYATRRLFLRRVGGGFIFTYRYLQSHFVDIKPTEGKDVN